MSYIKFDKECSICRGLGYLSKDKEIIPCDCLLIKKARDYLGPMYCDYPYSTKINWGVFKNFLSFGGFKRDTFKSIVKSFLLSSGLKIKYMSITPMEIIDVYFENKINDIFKELSKIEFLIIYFGSDTKNKLYEDYLYSVIDKRILYNLKTWIYNDLSFSDPKFIEIYSKKISNLILSNFIQVDILRDHEFIKGIRK